MGFLNIFKNSKSKTIISKTKTISSVNWLENKRLNWYTDYKHIEWKEFRDDYFKDFDGIYKKLD